MRVHELAKELKISSNELIDKLKKIKVKVKGHMSALDVSVVEKIKKESKASKPKKEKAKKEVKLKAKKTKAPAAKKKQAAKPKTRKKAAPKAKTEAASLPVEEAMEEVAEVKEDVEVKSQVSLLKKKFLRLTMV